MKNHMKSISFASLRIRLIILVLIIVLPLLGLMVYHGVEDKNQKRLSVLNESQIHARNASVIYLQVIAEVRQTLYHFSQMPQFLQQDQEASSQIFTRFLRQDETLIGLAAAKSNGDVFAAAPAIAKPLNFADRPWFQRLVQTRDFVIGEYTMGRISGKFTVVLGYPVLDHTGRLVTVLSAGLNTEHLQKTLTNIKLPDGVTLTVIDSNGTIILRSPDPEKLVGRPMPEKLIAKTILTQKEGAQEGIGFDGLHRLYGFTTIGSGSEAIHLCVSMLEQVAYAEIDQETVQNFTVAGLLGVLALLVAWLFGGRLIISPVNRLIKVTKQVADGDLTVRTGQSNLSGELGLLANNFDHMADSLQRREKERKLSEETLRESEERFREMAGTIQEVFWMSTPDLSRMFYLSPAFEAIWGRPCKSVFENPLAWVDAIHRDDRDRLLAALEEHARGNYDVEYRIVRPDGEVRWIYDHGFPVRDDAGQIVRMVGIAADITDRKREEQEKAIIAEIGRIIGSSLEICEVYERFAAEAKKLIPFDRLALNVKHPHDDAVIITYAFGSDVPLRMQGDPVPQVGMLTEEVLRTRTSLVLQPEGTPESIAEIVSRLPALSPSFQTGLLSFLSVPLIYRDEAVGVLHFRSKKTRAYTEQDRRLAERIGDQIAGAIANAQLFADLKKAEEEQRRNREEAESVAGERAVIAEIGMVVSSTVNIEEVYERFAGEVHKIIPFDRIVINIIDVEMNTVTNVYMAGHGITDRKVGVRYPLKGSGNFEMVRTKSSLLIQTEDFDEYKDRFPMLLSTFQAGFRSIMNVPLFSKGEIIGGLLLRSFKPYAYTEKDVRLAERVGSQIAGAIANAQLFAELKETEDTIKKSEERYRAILENIQEGYYEVDLAGNFTFFNPSMSKILGYTEEEMMGMNYRLYTEKETGKTTFRAFNEIYKTGISSRIDYELKKKDGSRMFAETSVALMRDSFGQPIGFRGVIRDVTERKKADRSLRESEGRFRALVEQAAVGVAEIELETGQFITVNRWLCELVGRTKEELLATTFYTITHPDDLHVHDDQMAQLAAGKISNYDLEKRYVRKDGAITWVNLTISPLWKPGDAHTHILAVSQDINERRRAEAELLTAHAKMALLINSISSILIAVSEDDRIVFWNTEAEKQFGIPEKEVLGKPLRELGIQWDLDQIMDGIARRRMENNSVGLDNVRFVQPNGKGGVLGINISPSFGEISFGMVTLIQGANITQRRMMESQLSQAQKLESIGQLAAGIAHEINTPTQYVGDNVRFLQTSFEALKKVLMKYEALTERIREGKACDDLLGEVDKTVQEADVGYLTEEIPTAFQQTLEGVERVSRIVQSMKAFAHPGTEEKVSVDINKAIENTILVARNEWKYVADLVADLDPSLPLVSCIPGDINQAILNVLVNAAQAVSEVVNGGSGGKGKISISTRQDGSWVEIRISDTGNGIPVEIRPRIFDPFFTTKEVGKGTGQGLTISHTAIVERHRGSITFNTEIGRGTTFTIRLPIKEPINAGNQET